MQTKKYKLITQGGIKLLLMAKTEKELTKAILRIKKNICKQKTTNI